MVRLKVFFFFFDDDDDDDDDGNLDKQLTDDKKFLRKYLMSLSNDEELVELEEPSSRLRHSKTH